MGAKNFNDMLSHFKHTNGLLWLIIPLLHTVWRHGIKSVLVLTFPCGIV